MIDKESVAGEIVVSIADWAEPGRDTERRKINKQKKRSK